MPRPSELSSDQSHSALSPPRPPEARDPWSLIPEPLRACLRGYLKLLLHWNRRINLVAPAEENLLVCRHLLDALELLKVVQEGPARVADIGSGAGLPGIPWAMARPELSLVLVEPRQRRAAFLRSAARELDLELEVREARAESLAAGGETFDIVVARALAPYPRWLELGAPLLGAGGCLIATAGSEPPEGWADPELCNRFGLSPELQQVYALPGIAQRRVLLLRKVCFPWGV